MQTGNQRRIDANDPRSPWQRELNHRRSPDRQKTAIAIDTILNPEGRRRCPASTWRSVRKSQASVAQRGGRARERGALDYTVVVAATLGPCPLNILPLPPAAAIAEYFMSHRALGHPVSQRRSYLHQARPRPTARCRALSRTPARREPTPAMFLLPQPHAREEPPSLPMPWQGQHDRALPIMRNPVPATCIAALTSPPRDSIHRGQILPLTL